MSNDSGSDLEESQNLDNQQDEPNQGKQNQTSENEDGNGEDDSEEENRQKNRQNKRRNAQNLKDQQSKKSKPNIFLQKNKLLEYEAEETQTDEESANSDKEIDEATKNQLLNEQLNKPSKGRQKFNQIISQATDEQINKRYNDQAKSINKIQKDFVPFQKDPKIWSVKVKKGQEKQLALQILNRAISNKDTPGQLDIFSVIAVEKFSEYIFIEAYFKKDVDKAIRDLDNIEFRKIDVLPPQDIRNLFKKQEKQLYPIKKKQFVRVLVPPYTGDLGQVLEISNDIFFIIVIPRIDPALFKINSGEPEINKNEANDDFNNENSRLKRQSFKKQLHTQQNRPNAQFLDEEELRRYQEKFPREKKKFLNNKYYKLRLHFKDFKYQDIDVQIPEVQNFFPEYKTLDELIKNEGNAIDLSQSQNFEVGDPIKVINGELVGLGGKIKKITQHGIEFVPDKTNITQMVKIEDAVKLFQPNDHVKVMRNMHAKKTGTVIKIFGDQKSEQAVIVVDGNNAIITVRTIDIKLSKQQMYSNDDSGCIQFKQYDLVKLTGNLGVGMILSISKDLYLVLMTDNTAKSFSFEQIDGQKPINTSKYSVPNNKGSLITKGAQVKVLHGLHQGASAQVIHVYESFLFLQNQEIVQNNGAFVLLANDVAQLTPGTALNISRKPGRANFIPTNPDTNADDKGAQPEQIKIGAKIKIKKGIYQNCQAYIRNYTKDSVTVELVQNHKKVQIKLSEIGIGTKEQSLKNMSEVINTPYVQKSPGYSLGQDQNNSSKSYEEVPHRQITKNEFN